MRLLNFITICFLITSCDFDQVENKYLNYNEATKDKFFEKGWIPATLIKESMTDIFVRNNLDLNTCIFSYRLSQPDFDSIKLSFAETKDEFKIPRRIKTPKWWFKNASVLNERFIIIDNNDTVFISIDSKNYSIYGSRY